MSVSSIEGLVHSPTTLVATLGGQPQIVTLMLDRLIDQGVPVDYVNVVYLGGNERYKAAFRKLAAEFTGDRYQGRICRLRSSPIRLNGRDLEDAILPQEVEAVKGVFAGLLAQLKAENHAVHLALGGGRRILALVALAMGLRYLRATDRLWHVNTPEDVVEQVRDGQLMHVEKEAGVRLIEVPFVPWVELFPGLEPLFEITPDQVRTTLGLYLSEEDRQRCAEVWGRLSGRPQQVLRLYALGYERQEIAEKLHIVPATVDTHRTAIVEECAAGWGLEKEEIGIRFLQEKFRPFLRMQDGQEYTRPSR